MSDNLNSIGIRGKIAARMPDYRYTLPEGGNPGDIPVKTETGVEWQQPEPATTTPDYNQNDETASDYIKNRPFYKIEGFNWGEEHSVTVENKYYYAAEKFVGDVRGTYDGTPFEFDMDDQGEFGYWGKKEFDAGTSDVYFQQNIALWDSNGSIYTRDGDSHTVAYQFGKVETTYKQIDSRFIPPLAAYAVTTDKIAQGAVGTFQLANDAVTERKLAKDAVTSDKIEKEAVTRDKIAKGSFQFCATNYNAVSGIMVIDPRVNASDKIIVSRLSDSDVHSPAVLEFVGSGSEVVHIRGINVLRLKSGNKEIDVTVSDNARPTFTDTSNPNNTWTPGENLPTVTTSDSGKFLRVSESGAWAAEAISNEMILNSSTEGSTKKFKITVDDSGTISATEVTQ